LAAELIAALRTTLEELPGLAVQLRSNDPGAPAEGGWSAREVLCHLADFELVAAVRVLAALSLDRPALAHFGQEELTRRFASAESAEEALLRFEVVRRSTLRRLELLRPEDWDRVAVHPERGPEPLRRTVEMIGRHDRGHLEQMRAALDRS
jgi:DinB superfamily